jgi:hypothetical protein
MPTKKRHQRILGYAQSRLIGALTSTTPAIKRTTLTMLSMLALMGCEPHSRSAAEVVSESAQRTVAQTQTNQLYMLIDGKEWRFENELMGGINPISDKPEMLMSGSRGANDGSEQTFTVMIRGADVPGTYRVKSGDSSQSVFQISGLSEQEFLAGNMMPFDLTVIVSEVGAKPMRMSARFAGSIETNTGRTLQISNGVFLYQE